MTKPGQAARDAVREMLARACIPVTFEFADAIAQAAIDAARAEGEASGEVVDPRPKNFGYPPNEPCASAIPGCWGTYAFTRLGERCSQCGDCGASEVSK